MEERQNLSRARDNLGKLVEVAKEELGLELGLSNRLGLSSSGTSVADRTRLFAPPPRQPSFSSSGVVESVPAPPPSPPISKEQPKRTRGPHDAALF